MTFQYEHMNNRKAVTAMLVKPTRLMGGGNYYYPASFVAEQSIPLLVGT